MVHWPPFKVYTYMYMYLHLYNLRSSLCTEFVEKALNEVEMAKIILVKILESGVSETKVSTKLRLTQFDGINDFCGYSSECRPDPKSSVELFGFIRNQTMAMFPNQNTVVKLKGWVKGSVVCDYEITIITPIRTLKVLTITKAKIIIF